MRAYILARKNAIGHWGALVHVLAVQSCCSSLEIPHRISEGKGRKIIRDLTAHPAGQEHDSAESATKEIFYFFPDVKQWLEKEEPLFKTGDIVYDEKKQVHTLKESL
ncbi:NDK6 kinase, partial [Polyodon spathula]|nr:NDK6 kinase [Polyodon spathula]